MDKYNDGDNDDFNGDGEGSDGDDDGEGSDGEMDETESGPTHCMMWAAGEAQLAAALLLTHLLLI